MTGTLGLFSLADLFQLLAASGRTGRLAIHHPSALARVYFERGRVVYADFGELIGEDAVYALFADERGAFEFQPGLPAPGVTVSGSTETLLMEAIRRLDESRKGLIRIADTAVPLLTHGGNPKQQLELSPHEMKMLPYLNGHYEVREIAELTEAPLDEVKALVDRLQAAGALRFAEQKIRTARLVVQLARHPLPTGSVALDQQIYESWTQALGAPPTEVACRRPDGRVEVLRVHPVAGAGPYLLASHEVLFKANLSAGDTLLVKPRFPEASA